MEAAKILAIFDDERRMLATPGYRKEMSGCLSRSIAGDSGWSWIDWSSHSSAEIEQAIDEQMAYFTEIGGNFEWKVYDHDAPADLRQRLTARGFQVGPAEAFLVLPISHLDLARKSGADVRKMQTIEQFEDYLAVEQVMWPDDGNNARSESRRRFLEHPDADGYYVGYFEGKPATCGRVTFREGSRFAGLFGGATLDDNRGRGLYTAVVTARAKEAHSRGVDFLFVDALPTSRPILERRGFRCLSYTYPCTWRADQAS